MLEFFGRLATEGACISHLATLRWPDDTIFSNIKAWLVGTCHSVSAKHLLRYLREWQYRFNRRNLNGGPNPWLIRRAVECVTITYDQIIKGALPGGAPKASAQPSQTPYLL